MALREIPLENFKSNPEKYLNEAIIEGKFFKIKTTCGTSVVIDEAEWNILVEALNMCLHQK